MSILSDELVCVGLSERSEEIWKSKVVTAIFFPELDFPPTSAQRDRMKGSHSSPLSRASSTCSRKFPTKNETFIDYPTPFISLTQTSDGTSLTADLRLLGSIFLESKSSRNDKLIQLIK